MRVFYTCVLSLWVVFAAASVTAREKPQVVTLSGLDSFVNPFYTTYEGAPFLSFLRIINPQDFQNEITLTGINATTGQIIGTCFLAIPAKAAPQYSAQEIQDCLGWQPTIPGTDNVLTITADFGDYLLWQHVVWSPTTGYFANVSSCREPWVQDDFLANVHTSTIIGYPSSVTGYINVPLDYFITLDIHDGRTGELIGDYTSQLYSSLETGILIDMADVEADGNFSVPAGSLPSHVNLQITVRDVTGAVFQTGEADLLGHLVIQTDRQELYQMAHTCAY